MKSDYEIIEFKDSDSFRHWLATNSSSIDGVWIRIFKKATGLTSITHAEALDNALCFGWIDGQRKGLDDISFLQKFTPRRKASLWSKRNIEIIERLTEQGLMTPSGIAEVDRAKSDGRWEAAYDKPSEMVIPEYFLDALKENPKATEYFEKLNKTSKYSIGWSLQTAKTDETRKRRQEKIIKMLESGIAP